MEFFSCPSFLVKIANCNIWPTVSAHTNMRLQAIYTPQGSGALTHSHAQAPSRSATELNCFFGEQVVFSSLA